LLLTWHDNNPAFSLSMKLKIMKILLIEVLQNKVHSS